MSTEPINIAVVDDHHLFRSGLINLIHSFGKKFKVTIEASNGRELFNKLQTSPRPDILLMDLNMPVMDGFEASLILQKKHPQVKVLVITMVDDERTMIKMLRRGIKGYLSKDVEPEELKTALETTVTKGFYFTDHITGKLIHAMHDNAGINIELSDREQKFLELACSESTYKEIADQMFLSVKTIDGYRNDLFQKLEVKSRVGLVLYAIKNNLVQVK